MEIKDFTDLIVWQKSDLLFSMIVRDIEDWPKTRVGLVVGDQIIRSIGSISSNIAEGYGSDSRKEFRHCFMISRKENSESWNWLIKINKLGYVSNRRFQEYEAIITEIKKMLNSLVGKLKT